MSFRNVSVGCPNTVTTTMYYHNASAAVPFTSPPGTVTYVNTVCSIFSPTFNQLAYDFWKPFNNNSTLTSFEPGSAYQITAKTRINIRQEGQYIAKSTRQVGPLFTYVSVDDNSLPVALDSLPGADKNKIITVWTTDNSFNCSGPVFTWNYWKPTANLGLTTLQPGSAYFIYTQGTFTLNLPRKNQYLITHPANTPPNAFIKTQSGDYLVTQQSG